MLTTSKFQANDLIELLLMYVIAGYIKKYGFSKKLKSSHWMLLWLLFTLITLMSSVVLLLVGKRWPIASSHSTYFYGQTSILTIARAVCFFMAFLTMKISNHSWINKVSSAMFGVYLLHDSKLLRQYLWKDLFNNASYQDTISIIPYSIFAILIVFICCTIIDILRQIAIECPLRKKLVKVKER